MEIKHLDRSEIYSSNQTDGYKFDHDFFTLRTLAHAVMCRASLKLIDTDSGIVGFESKSQLNDGQKLHMLVSARDIDEVDTQKLVDEVARRISDRLTYRQPNIVRIHPIEAVYTIMPIGTSDAFRFEYNVLFVQVMRMEAPK